jgi:PUA domain protein
MKSRQLNKNEVKELSNELEEKYGKSFFSKRDRVEIIDDKILKVDGSQAFFKLENQWIPLLKILQTDNFLKQIVIDMPAVPFITKGADLMRPGVVELDEGIEKGEIIAIVDENHKKPLAVGKTLFSGQEMKVQDKGKIVKNLHFVGDSFWNL